MLDFYVKFVGKFIYRLHGSVMGCDSCHIRVLSNPLSWKWSTEIDRPEHGNLRLIISISSQPQMLNVWSIYLHLGSFGLKQCGQKDRPYIPYHWAYLPKGQPVNESSPGDSKWPFDPLVGGHLTPFQRVFTILTIPKRSRIESPGPKNRLPFGSTLILHVDPSPLAAVFSGYMFHLWWICSTAGVWKPHHHHRRVTVKVTEVKWRLGKLKPRKPRETSGFHNGFEVLPRKLN